MEDDFDNEENWQDDDFEGCDEPYGVDDTNSAYYNQEEFA